MKYSRQRELIENTVMENRIHPTADDVYAILKPKHSTLSLGTVYRNLNTLADLGKIKKLSMPNGVSRYDGDVSEHYHACCNSCGKVYDIMLAKSDGSVEKGLTELGRLANLQTGLHIISQDVYLNGICKDCEE